MEVHKLCFKNWSAITSNAISEAFRTQSFTDMSISAGESVFACHKIIISSVISKLKPSIMHHSRQKETPSLILNMDPFIVKLILDFVYTGEVNVPSDYLADFVRDANFLGVRGLCSEPADVFNAAVTLHQFRHTNNQMVGSPETYVPQAPSISPSHQTVVGNISAGSGPSTPSPEHSCVVYPSQTYQSCSSETQNDRRQSVSPSQGESCSQPGETAVDPERVVGYMSNVSMNFDWYILCFLTLSWIVFHFLNHYLQAAAYDSDDSDCGLQIDEGRDTETSPMQYCEGKNTRIAILLLIILFPIKLWSSNINVTS